MTSPALRSRRPLTLLTWVMAGGALALSVLALPARAETTAAAQLEALQREAGSAPQPTRGQTFFTTKHGQEWSCASCHGVRPVDEGRHAATGKLLRPLAPAFEATRFTDAAKTEKWFRRNCKDVVGRECTPAEKADVLAWLLTLTR